MALGVVANELEHALLTGKEPSFPYHGDPEVTPDEVTQSMIDRIDGDPSAGDSPG